MRDLTNANLVVIYGSSGGAGGLQMMLDAEAAHVATVSQARVVGLSDSRAELNLAGAEGLFDAASCSSVFAADCRGTFNVPPFGTDVDAGFYLDTSSYEPESAACRGVRPCASSAVNLDAERAK